MNKVEILKQKGYHFLWVDDYLWMWDLPVEVEIQKDIAEEAFGDVLVAGYGLGIVQKFLLNNDKVNSVLTDEKHHGVVDACQRAFARIYGKIVICDFDDFPYGWESSWQGKKWDCVIGDIWPEIWDKYLDEYVEYRNHAQTLLREGGKILGWGVDYYEYLLQK